MNNTAYIERSILDSAQAQEILARARPSNIVEIDRYGEVFNPKAQNFRLQKLNPALIIAEKHGKFVLPTPEGYGIGGSNNYYFSHMMNCIYDCRYCFLQGMYQSANHVVFANYDAFFNEISHVSQRHENESVWFFSGYDCDSLALEPVTRFMSHCLDYFSPSQEQPNPAYGNAPANAHLEIRTKSTQIRDLLKRKPLINCVIAYSLSPQPIVAEIEHKTPSLGKRIDALKKLQQQGWPIGLRFDPLIAAKNFEQLYADMFDEVFDNLDMGNIHSISLGTFRLPKPFFKKIIKLYPEEPMLAVSLDQSSSDASAGNSKSRQTMVSYPQPLEQDMMSFCSDRILSAIDASRFFPCHT